jgi:hypothetical protein
LTPIKRASKFLEFLESIKKRARGLPYRLEKLENSYPSTMSEMSENVQKLTHKKAPN